AIAHLLVGVGDVDEHAVRVAVEAVSVVPVADGLLVVAAVVELRRGLVRALRAVDVGRRRLLVFGALGVACGRLAQGDADAEQGGRAESDSPVPMHAHAGSSEGVRGQHTYLAPGAEKKRGAGVTCCLSRPGGASATLGARDGPREKADPRGRRRG